MLLPTAGGGTEEKEIPSPCLGAPGASPGESTKHPLSGHAEHGSMSLPDPRGLLVADNVYEDSSLELVSNAYWPPFKRTVFRLRSVSFAARGLDPGCSFDPRVAAAASRLLSTTDCRKATATARHLPEGDVMVSAGDEALTVGGEVHASDALRNANARYLANHFFRIGQLMNVRVPTVLGFANPGALDVSSHYCKLCYYLFSIVNSQ